MPFSLSGGLSAMGKSISDTAGDMMMTAQRAELDKQRITLAESLAEGRETRGREQAADIADKASTKDQTFRAGESLLNREANADLAEVRETHEDARAKLQRDVTISTHNSSEKSADDRFNREMDLRVKQAQEATKDREEKRILDLAIAASTKKQPEPYTTADGATATRIVDVFNPEKAAGILRDKGHENLASYLMPRPKDAKKANVDGKPRPPLESFLGGK